MTEDFLRSCDIVVDKLEGGAKLITDTGGLTKYGISAKSYPGLDIKNLTREQALALYEADFWAVMKCDKLPWPLSVLVFDAAVNQGQGTAGKMLQAALELPQDGIIGVQTLTKIMKQDALEISARFMAKRAMRYMGTKGFDKYGFGWLCRIMRLALSI